MMEKLRAAYQRMNQRERMMTLAIAAVLVLLINMFVWKSVFGTINSSRRELASRKATRSEQTVYMKERELWAKRDQWLQKTQPTLKGAEEASTLLDQLKQIAGKYNVLVENPAIGSGETTPNHQAVFASIETSSHWPELVHFLYDVQQPDAFIVFESVNLAIDGNDATMMRGKFKIARWFAPPQRKQG
jgi:type II secretory pathway component PulM